MSVLIEKRMTKFIHNALNHKSVCKSSTYLLYTKLRYRHIYYYTKLRYRNPGHSCLMIIFNIYLISMNYVYLNGKIYLIPGGKVKIN